MYMSLLPQPTPTRREPIHPKKPHAFSSGREGLKFAFSNPEKTRSFLLAGEDYSNPPTPDNTTRIVGKIFASKVFHLVLQIPRRNTHRLSSFLKLAHFTSLRFHKTLVMTHYLAKRGLKHASSTHPRSEYQF